MYLNVYCRAIFMSDLDFWDSVDAKNGLEVAPTSDLDSWDWVISKSVLTCSDLTTGSWETAKKSCCGGWVVGVQCKDHNSSCSSFSWRSDQSRFARAELEPSLSLRVDWPRATSTMWNATISMMNDNVHRVVCLVYIYATPLFCIEWWLQGCSQYPNSSPF